MDESVPQVIRQVISVGATPDAFYVVKALYDEGDAVNAVGQVVRADWTPDHSMMDLDRPRGQNVLVANDSLQALWVSPEAHLWIISARGTVWTTAPVDWPPQRWAPLDYDSLDPGLSWSVTTVPDWSGGYPPGLQGVWGTGDDDVHVCSYEGALFHWDGVSWELVHEAGVSLNALHGSARDDVYCVGADSTVLRFDGRSWASIAYPADDCPRGGRDVLTGVRATGEGRVVIAGLGGAIVAGPPHDLAVVTVCDTGFYGVARFRDRVYLAGGPTGLWVLEAGEARVAKASARSLGLVEIGPVLLMIPDDQFHELALFQYAPDAPRPWTRLGFGPGVPR
ncbi:hypothetical protein [Herbiconiux sp. YIM B11900]|uniref:hypothetical protein n=1 Tax=Herbiconiux sp. YIM B11900 TaxID=3404131 RepID=UPI003F8526C8